MVDIQVWDPGKSTGIVYGNYSSTIPLEIHTVKTVSQAEALSLIGGMGPSGGQKLVVESFQLRGSNTFTADLTGVEIIGAIKLWRLMHPELDLSWQPPSKKAAVPDSTLKALGEWRTGATAGWLVRDPSVRKTGRHVNDAIIHAYAYMISIGHQPTIRVIEEALNG